MCFPLDASLVQLLAILFLPLCLLTRRSLAAVLPLPNDHLSAATSPSEQLFSVLCPTGAVDIVMIVCLVQAIALGYPDKSSPVTLILVGRDPF